MASNKKQKAMVFHQDGTTSPAAASAANQPPACFATLKPEKASEGGMEQGTHIASKEEGMMGHPSIYQTREDLRKPGCLPSVKHSNPQSEKLSPDAVCKDIKVVLDNNSMWNEFFRCKTEMIITKQGSRMFPYCRFRISGLQPSRNYCLFMDIQLVDNSRYEWTGKSWQVAGKAERHVKSQPFFHPESPSLGQHWMKNPVSFYKLKLTSNTSDLEGNTVLHPMHRYLPRLHVVQSDKTDKDIKLNGPNVVTFTFPQTEFTAVTAYQNSQFVQLKVNYNPFSKGLKEDGCSLLGLKLKSSTGKDGGATTSEQHPMKKNLKSLLANHKPRSSKALDSKPAVPSDVHKDAPTNDDQSASKETSCSNSRPTQKLFSELMREAHVSLQRCNLEQLGISHSPAQANTRTTASEGSGHDAPQRNGICDITPSTTLPAEGEAAATKKTVKEGSHHVNSVNCTDTVGVDCGDINSKPSEAVVTASSGPQNSSSDSGNKRTPEAQSEVSAKQHRRPAPLPLPALALFLKRHSSKSKKAKTETGSSPTRAPLDSKPETAGSASASACAPSDHTSNATGQSKDSSGDISKPENQALGAGDTDPQPDKMDLKVPGQAVEIAHQTSVPFCEFNVATPDLNGQRTDDYVSSVPASESLDPPCSTAHGTPVLLNSDQQFVTLETSMSTESLTLTTSSASPILSTHFDTVLPALDAPHTPTITGSLSTMSSDSKSDTLLPDPECSHFVFEPLSPASSPEPLPSLPASLALDLDSTPSEPAPKAMPPEELQLSKLSAPSVFKWHTVLPPPEPYIDASFTAFSASPQTLPLVSDEAPLLPSQTPDHPASQTLNPSSSTPPPDPSPSFQENDQSLPFPAELSPLALQLTLSPTFSSLDGDGLSPTPSIADLVHFFSTDDDLGMEVEFANTEAVALPCPPPPSAVETDVPEPPQQAQPIPEPKSCKRKKRSRRQKLTVAEAGQKVNDSTYTTLQPNLEEVEEQLFISFTSKEALKLHILDSLEGVGPVTQPQMPPEVQLQQSAEESVNVSTVEAADGFKDTIAAFEKILLRDLKLMKHRQIIHPVLQEVGLKMNLLDPTLAIDLQYLGVRLPIPPPGASLEPLPQELPPSHGVCAAFVSRTGKTTDVTQIKGWREKFTPSEASSAASSSSKSEAAASSDQNKKNLSAFCSDMLDEYLENEGKLIDERAANFSQAPVEAPVYELPARSTSYVRTLNSVLKKQQTSSSPTSDLISGFIPPSKRPKLPLGGLKTTRRGERRQNISKQYKHRPEVGAIPAKSRPAIQTPTASPPSEHTAPITESPRPKKIHLKGRALKANADPSLDPSRRPALGRRKRLKPKNSSQTLSPAQPMNDMAPLESDSELGGASTPESSRRPMMTRALLKQKDLEDSVVWQGHAHTSVTEERASIALTSLFTLMGFASENPTAPIQLPQRQAPSCLNDFCRLGCICSSLAYTARSSHCGHSRCMLGCSCLKQKVVLLKNLDGSDSSPSHHSTDRKRRRKRRMKMAYVLKEAESVSQPAKRVRILWKKGSADSDPDPIYVPESSTTSCSTEMSEDNSSCARVRSIPRRRKMQKSKQTAIKTKDAPLKSERRGPFKGKRVRPGSGHPSATEAAQPAASDPAESPPAELKPSRRLIILAEFQCKNDADRNDLLKELCKAMAQDRLDKPFWVRNFLVRPISQTVEESDGNHCIQYKIHVSQPRLKQEKPAALVKRKVDQQVNDQKHVEEVGPLEDWQREVMDEEELLDDWQREVEEDDVEEEEMKEERESKPSTEMLNVRVEKKKKKKMVGFALPFLTGICPAGFLIARKKQPDCTDHPIEVNGKLYPLAKIQLGKMGALHPANRLAAYLTGRVGSNRCQQDSASSSEPPRTQQAVPSTSSMLSGSSSASIPQSTSINTVPSSSIPTSTSIPSSTSFSTSIPTSVTYISITPPSSQSPAAGFLGPSISSSVTPPAVVRTDQTAAFSKPAGEASEGVGSCVVKVAMQPGATAAAPQVRLLPGAAGSPAPIPGSVVPQSPQVLMVQVPSPSAKVPAQSHTARLPAPLSADQKVALKPIQQASGLRYYRRSDGKLFKLIPVSQLRSVSPNLLEQRGPSSPPVLPAATVQQLAVNAVPQPPMTNATTSISGLSSLQQFSVPRLSVPLQPSSGFLNQKGMCTFKIIPASSNKDHLIVTCPKVPPKPPTKVVTASGSFSLLQPNQPAPINLISLKPSASQGAELGVKTVSVLAGPVLQKPQIAAIQTPAGVTDPNQTPARTADAAETATGTSAATQISKGSSSATVTAVGTAGAAQTPGVIMNNGAASGPDVTYPPSSERAKSEPQLASAPVDLDIVCVDDEIDVLTTDAEEVKQVVEVVDLMDSSSGDTENSSDFGDELDDDQKKESVEKARLHSHNMQERRRQWELCVRFSSLRREMGLSEKTSKVSTLNKAVEVIEDLRMTEMNLKRMKGKLMRRRDSFLNIITPTAGENGQAADGRAGSAAGSGSTNGREADRVESENAAELTSGRDEVAVETRHESSGLSAAPRDAAGIVAKMDSESVESVMKSVAERSLSDSFKALSSVLSVRGSSPKHHLLKQACQEIRSLQNQMEKLKSSKFHLKQLRDAHIRDISQWTGKREQCILRKLQHLTSKQSKLEKQKLLKAANQLPPTGGGASAPQAAGGGASAPAAGDASDEDVIITSCVPQQQKSPAPSPAAAPAAAAPAAPAAPALKPAQQPPNSSQAAAPVKSGQAPPSASHAAALLRDRPKTIPNILSRCKTAKNPAPAPQHTTAAEADPVAIQAVVPAEVLSLVSTALPGQPLLALSPLVMGQAALQSAAPGVTSVTLNVPSLANQQIQLASLPHPSAGNIYSSSAPLTVTNLAAANFNSLLHLVQPPEQRLQQYYQPLQQQHQQQQPENQLLPEAPLMVPAGPAQTSDQSKDRSGSPAESCTPSPLETSVAGRGDDADAKAGPAGVEHPEQREEDAESLTSLLNEIVFLNQQAATAPALPEKPAKEVAEEAEPHGRSHSPWLLQLDSDSDDTVAAETGGAGPSQDPPPRPGSAEEQPASGILAPPPLLQMKVGGAKPSDPASSSAAARGGQQVEGGVAWRPMPRLVPLGLRGAPPS